MRERTSKHVIIGAGITGIVLAGELGEGAVILDPNPGGYKVGESVIPEQFHDPRMAQHLDAVCALSSWSPKLGTLFVDAKEACFFPLAQHHQRSMHIFRQELEALLMERLGVHVERERVLRVEGRRVYTDRGSWLSEGPVLDCSGPAMVVASGRDDVESLWPVWASWSYFDVEPLPPSEFWNAIDDWRSTALDVPSGRMLESPQGRADPTQLTGLVRVDDGLWVWQIPLFRRRVLSVGVVSRRGPVDQETYQRIVAEHLLPAWRATPRAGRDPVEAWCGPLGPLPPSTCAFHHRDGFARKAGRAATEDFVLLGDAYAFADPVYSVGTGLSVTQALALSPLLKGGQWNAASAQRYHDNAARGFDRAVQAFQFWYDGKVLHNDAIARQVQDGFLIGGSFRAGAVGAYSHVVTEAMRAAEQGLGVVLAELIAPLAGGPWRVEASLSSGAVLLVGPGGVLEVSGACKQAWRQVDGFGLSYRGPRPPDNGLAEQLCESLRVNPAQWRSALDCVSAMCEARRSTSGSAPDGPPTDPAERA